MNAIRAEGLPPVETCRRLDVARQLVLSVQQVLNLYPETNNTVDVVLRGKDREQNPNPVRQEPMP